MQNEKIREYPEGMTSKPYTKEELKSELWEREELDSHSRRRKLRSLLSLLLKFLPTTSSCTYMLYCIGQAWCLQQKLFHKEQGFKFTIE